MLNPKQLEVGQRLRRPGAPLTQQAFNDFGALLGTDAPIHVDPDYAAKTPFGGTIAQGMLLLAPFESWLCDLFGEEAWSRNGWLKAKLLHPARVGDDVTLEMVVRKIEGSRIAFELNVIHGEKLLATGEAAIHGDA